MDEIKILQIRDRGTSIPAMAIKPFPETDNEISIFRGAGFGIPSDYVILTALNGLGSSYDPYAWGVNPRTMHIAHKALVNNWDQYETGGVVCVEHILGELLHPKEFERWG